MSQRGMVQKIPSVRTSLIPPKNAEPAGFTHDGKHQLWRQPRRMNHPLPNIEAEVSELCGTDDRGRAVHSWKDDTIDHPVCKKCGTVGERLYKTHSQTNEKIIAIRRPNIVDEARLFYLEDCGNCNVAIVDYVPPTEEEIADQKRREDLAAMGGGYLGQVFVDAGISKEEAPDVVRKLRELSKPEAPVAPRGEIPDEQPETELTTGATTDEPETFTAAVMSVPEERVYPIKDEKGPWWTLSDGTRLRGEEAAHEAEAELAAERQAAHAVAAEAAEGSY